MNVKSKDGVRAVKLEKAELRAIDKACEVCRELATLLDDGDADAAVKSLDKLSLKYDESRKEPAPK